MATDKRLIEVAFPLRQVSLDSVHEKSVRRGHIATLHLWPARRPLSACRAALIASLLPDPGNDRERNKILEKMAGRIERFSDGKFKEATKERTVNGILHWGREQSAELEWFREKIRNSHGGRNPKVLDPFAGGGAIPLEAMRLGCEVTASDINPVAWFILKCTLDYPNQLAGKKRRLPKFALENREFMEKYLTAAGYKKSDMQTILEEIGHGENSRLDVEMKDHPAFRADLAWHVRAWGEWVQECARKELSRYYPVFAEFTPVNRDAGFEPKSRELLSGRECVSAQIDKLNSQFTRNYLNDSTNARWVARPIIAYLWVRTVKCKSCRVEIPLIKTRWLSKKDTKRVLLTVEPDTTKFGVKFGVKYASTENKRRKLDRGDEKKIGAGTMSRSGASCVCCGSIMTLEDIRFEGQAGRMGAVPVVAIVDGNSGKGYRALENEDFVALNESIRDANGHFMDIPFAEPNEKLPETRKKGTSGFSVILYGLDSWAKLFGARQLMTMGNFVRLVRSLKDEVQRHDYPSEWACAISSLNALAVDKVAATASTISHWHNKHEKIVPTFQRYALQMSWDFVETNLLSGRAGSYSDHIDWIANATAHLCQALVAAPTPKIKSKSAILLEATDEFDLIVTDPPYYDAIAYSDVMDFFYVWLRRVLWGLDPEIDQVMSEPSSPKWDESRNDGELIDDRQRFGGDRNKSKQIYENGMSRVFKACSLALKDSGRLVLVFAHKSPNAWETLVSAIIRAGFVVTGSWPIQTEMKNRINAQTTASLSASLWLVCRKRLGVTRPGWDNQVLDEIRKNIHHKLREFWDMGIRGPDFVWAATGPALEVYSKHPVVKKANTPEECLTVSDFLREVRRIVADFVVGRALTTSGSSSDETATESLDDVTTYYLLHLYDFGMTEAPIGACILYALSCNLSDSALIHQHDLLLQVKGASVTMTSTEVDETTGSTDDLHNSSGSSVKLKAWHQRQSRHLGLESSGGGPIPLIDQVHKLMHLWRTGDQRKVDSYLGSRGLKQMSLFNQLLQALIELSASGSDDRALLESLSKHIATHDQAGAEQISQLPTL